MCARARVLFRLCARENATTGERVRESVCVVSVYVCVCVSVCAHMCVLDWVFPTGGSNRKSDPPPWEKPVLDLDSIFLEKRARESV